ncbi:hypothetical protein Godav_011520, partial [Gossypium davidsonii]|nr:hypothetical protein [Gossypium davidsonii]MBA0645807.1 hypothetical protein [Gossypium klotzschianum]
VAEDDASLVKHIGQSFRFSAIEKRREEQLKAAHDEAIFGTSTASLSVTADSEPEEENLKKDSNDNAVATGLLSEKGERQKDALFDSTIVDIGSDNCFQHRSRQS